MKKLVFIFIVILALMINPVLAITPAEQRALDQQNKQQFLDELAQRDAYIQGYVDQRADEVAQELNDILRIRLIIAAVTNVAMLVLALFIADLLRTFAARARARKISQLQAKPEVRYVDDKGAI